MKIMVDVYDALGNVGYPYGGTLAHSMPCLTEKEAIECAQKFLEPERTCKIVIRRIYE